MSKNNNCKRCKHRTEFTDKDGNIMYLCTSEPYEDEEEFGVITWLDVNNFHSDECMNFKFR